MHRVVFSIVFYIYPNWFLLFLIVLYCFYSLPLFSVVFCTLLCGFWCFFYEETSLAKYVLSVFYCLLWFGCYSLLFFSFWVSFCIVFNCFLVFSIMFYSFVRCFYGIVWFLYGFVLLLRLYMAHSVLYVFLCLLLLCMCSFICFV